MNPKLTSLVACSIAIAALSLVNAGLVAYTVLTFDKQTELHDRVLAAETAATIWEKTYTKLLERVGGAETPDVPLPKRPSGNSGNKS